ncbi:MAG: hypothetical protein GC159_00085 [Phycisphaera sp.]|nr:hypothetical protein [Phycisphaera sp.]
MKRNTKRALIGSLVVHVTLLGGLIWWGLTPVADHPATVNRERKAKERAEAEAEPKPEPSPVPQGVTEKMVEAKIKDAVENPPNIDPELAQSELEKKAAYVDKNISEQSVKDITKMVRSAIKAEDRAYAPVDPPPPGAFDFQSMLPYSSKREVGTDGKQRSVEIWIDKAGRTMTKTTRKGTDENGNVVLYQGTGQKDAKGDYIEFATPYDKSQETLTNVLEIMGRSPALQRLFSEGFLPVLNSERKKAAPQGEPGAASDPPADAPTDKSATEGR